MNGDPLEELVALGFELDEHYVPASLFAVWRAGWYLIFRDSGLRLLNRVGLRISANERRHMDKRDSKIMQLEAIIERLSDTLKGIILSTPNNRIIATEKARIEVAQNGTDLQIIETPIRGNDGKIGAEREPMTEYTVRRRDDDPSLSQDDLDEMEN